MKAENTKQLYIVIALLSLIVIAQGYFMYALNGTMPAGVHNASHQEKGLHSFFNSPEPDPFKQIKQFQEKMHHDMEKMHTVFSNDPFFTKAYEPILPMSDMK